MATRPLHHHAEAVREVRREDGELCGFVALDGGRWRSLTVFGGALGEHDEERDAHARVASDGLASLAERWTLVDRTTGDEDVVCIQQASPEEVTVALAPYSMPGVPTATIRAEDLRADGRWRLERRR